MLKRRLLPIFIILASVPIATTQAQVVVWKKGQQSIGDSIAEQSLEQPKARVAWDAPRKLRLTPAAEPTPALKYRFWIPPVERQAGDVKTHLDRAIMMSLQDDRRQELTEEYAQVSSKLYGESDERIKPSDEVLEQVRQHLEKQADVLKQLHYALSLDTIDRDYALRDRRGRDFFVFNPPHIQGMRHMARLLQLECQLAVAEGRYDDAIATVRDGYRIAEATVLVGEQTLVCQLVSIAIVGIMDSEVEFMAQQQESPNMYWGLASLPSEQLFSIRSAIEGEAISTLQALFPWEADQAATTEKQAEARLIELIGLSQQAIEYAAEPLNATQQAQQQAVAAIAVLLFADRARVELDKPQLGNCQAVLKWTQSDFVRLLDDVFKWMLLPVQERRVYENRVEASMPFLRGSIAKSPGEVLAGIIFPAVEATDAAAQRSQRRHAFLITLQALRAYAAENNGELPETLDNLYPLPAWSDPTTGKPFTYRRTDPRHAVLTTEKSIGMPNEFHIEMAQRSGSLRRSNSTSTP